MYVYVGTSVRVFVFSSRGVGGGSMLVSVSVFCGWGCFLGWWWVCLCYDCWFDWVDVGWMLIDVIDVYVMCW